MLFTLLLFLRLLLLLLLMHLLLLLSPLLFLLLLLLHLLSAAETTTTPRLFNYHYTACYFNPSSKKKLKEKLPESAQPVAVSSVCQAWMKMQGAPLDSYG